MHVFYVICLCPVHVLFFNLFYLLFVLRVCSEGGGLVAGSGPPAVSLRRLLCLAVVLVACRASVAGSFGSCRACGQLSASSGWFWGIFLLWAGGPMLTSFPLTSCVLIARTSGTLDVCFGGSSRGLGLYRLLLFGVLLGWRGARGQLWASSGWFSGLLSFAGHLWPAPRV